MRHTWKIMVLKAVSLFHCARCNVAVVRARKPLPSEYIPDEQYCSFGCWACIAVGDKRYEKVQT